MLGSHLYDTDMATQATESLAVADSLPAIDNTNSTINHTLNRNLTGTAAITSIHTDIEDKRISTPESSNSGGVLSQEITKDGKHLLVTWTKDEERRIVRKVDFILLPLFSVSFCWLKLDERFN